MRSFSTASVLLSLATSIAVAEVKQTIDKESGLISWFLIDEGVELELEQRLPDQTRAFFQARGFSAAISDDIATNCVYKTVIKNNFPISDPKSISINLHEWSLQHNGELSEIKYKELWDKEWSEAENKEEQVSNASRIAFRWATFPTQQVFEAGGDYNWGMISFGLPPGQAFDLLVKWKIDDNQHETWIKNMRCPEDKSV